MTVSSCSGRIVAVSSCSGRIVAIHVDVGVLLYFLTLVRLFILTSLPMMPGVLSISLG